jgi:tellurite resistance protein TerC
MALGIMGAFCHVAGPPAQTPLDEVRLAFMSAEELIAGLTVIAGLVVLEGLLSVDNVLGIAALANELPPAQQKKAIRIGLFLAYLFRVLALFVAGWLATNTWVRWLGAGYLVWLMSSHLTKGHAHDVGETLLDEDLTNDGKPAKATPPRHLRVVLIQIGLMDLSLSIDNVIAAVGLAPKTESGDPVMWPIYAGVLIAILALQQIAPHAMNLLKKYPILEPTAFILIGYVGALLIGEEAYHLITGAPVHLPAYFKFIGILMIIIVALSYEADAAVRRTIKPLITMSMPVMRGVTRVVSFIIWPLEQLIGMI